MSSTTMAEMVCAACGYSTTPGTSLRVTEHATGSTYPVHRPSVADGCLRAAGSVQRSALAAWDLEAARLYDRRSANRLRRPITTQETLR